MGLDVDRARSLGTRAFEEVCAQERLQHVVTRAHEDDIGGQAGLLAGLVRSTTRQLQQGGAEALDIELRDLVIGVERFEVDVRVVGWRLSK